MIICLGAPEFLVTPLGDIKMHTYESNAQWQLPLHTRYACHSLNLIVTKDTEEALKSAPYGSQHHMFLWVIKCQALWNAFNHSSKDADKVAEICQNKKLLVPGQTRI